MPIENAAMIREAMIEANKIGSFDPSSQLPT
jgi:hypothetical protein